MAVCNASFSILHGGRLNWINRKFTNQGAEILADYYETTEERIIYFTREGRDVGEIE